MVIADLADPLISAQEASAIFSILLQRFKVMDTCSATAVSPGRKLAVLDNAHLYLNGEVSSPGQFTIVNVIML